MNGMQLKVHTDISGQISDRKGACGKCLHAASVKTLFRWLRKQIETRRSVSGSCGRTITCGGKPRQLLSNRNRWSNTRSMTGGFDLVLWVPWSPGSRFPWGSDSVITGEMSNGYHGGIAHFLFLHSDFLSHRVLSEWGEEVELVWVMWGWDSLCEVRRWTWVYIRLFLLISA